MNLEFIIDQEYDRKFLNTGRKISEKDNFDAIYKNSLVYLQNTASQYQNSWNDIGQEFSEYVSQETGYDWFHQTYFCVVSIVSSGISNWGQTPVIIRGWDENFYTQRRITAHELILSHYFEIYKHHYDADAGLLDTQVWALAEIAAFALTGLTSKAKSFWPWDNSGYYNNHNYPHIVGLQNSLKSIFLERNDFDEYIKAGIELVRPYKTIRPNM